MSREQAVCEGIAWLHCATCPALRCLLSCPPRATRLERREEVPAHREGERFLELALDKVWNPSLVHVAGQHLDLQLHILQTQALAGQICGGPKMKSSYAALRDVAMQAA